MRTDPLLVAVLAAVLSVPVLLGSLAQDLMPLETALLRCGVVVLVTWLGTAALALLLRATDAGGVVADGPAVAAEVVEEAGPDGRDAVPPA
jgi:hypothetical protein